MMGATLRDGLLVMTFRNSREHCGDSTAHAALSVSLRSMLFLLKKERLCMAEKACLSP